MCFLPIFFFQAGKLDNKKKYALYNLGLGLSSLNLLKGEPYKIISYAMEDSSQIPNTVLFLILWPVLTHFYKS